LALYQGGRVPIDEVLKAVQRRAAAGIELTPAEKENHLRAAFESAAVIEGQVKDKYDNDVEPAHALYEARQRRMTFEIELLRVAAKPPANKQAQLQRLLKERLETATKEVADRKALFQGGRMTLSDVAAAIQRQAQAGVEASTDPAEQIKHREAAFQAAKEIEALVREKFENSVESKWALQFAIGERLTAEIELLRARHKAAER
jgi:hypothetical protein